MSDEKIQPKVFGNRLIYPIGVYPNKGKGATPTIEVGTFEMSNGGSSLPAKYRQRIDMRIPKDVSNFNAGAIKEPTWEEALIFFGELHFGAKWDAAKNIYVETEESQRWRKKSHRDKIQFLEQYDGMDESKMRIMSKKVKSRFSFNDKGEAISYKGFGEEKHRALKHVVESYHSDNLEKLKFVDGKVSLSGEKMENIFPKETEKTKEERDRLRAAKKDFKSSAVEVEDTSKKAFANLKMPDGYPYMQNYAEKLRARNIEKWEPRISGVWKVFLINGMVNKPYELTVGQKGKPLEEKLDLMKLMVARYQRWASRYYTNEEFYKTKWKEPFSGQEIGFPPNIWEELEDFSERDHKRGLPRKWTVAKQDNFRKKAADLLASFVANAPKDLWEVGKQPAKTILSKKTVPPKYAIQGQDVDDLQIREALKFLETGQKHKWQQKVKDGKKVFQKLNQLNENGETETIIVEVMELVPDETDTVVHYNTTLKEYINWGSPYSPTAPASMFFRMSILTGWRKTEALTCPTRIVGDQALEQRKEGIRAVGANPSGIEWKDGILNVAFLTRKTSKIGKTFFQAAIPPFSSETMDTRETIELILQQADIGKWKSRDFYSYYTDKESGKYIEEENDNWKAEVIPFTQKEKDELFPKHEVKGKKGVTALSRKGEHSKLLIGYEGQFYPTYFPEPINEKQVMSFDAPTGSELDDLEDPEMVDAYLNFPLRECYTMMTGTSMKVKSAGEIREQAEKDREHDKSLKIFDMVDGWATICSDGCPKSTIGKKHEGLFSKERNEQDRLRYETKEGEHYWNEKPNHSMRHVFAQLWLEKSNWNYGVVADRGHWETLDVLKDHYGGMNQNKLAEFMVQVLGKKQVGKEKGNQQMDTSIGKRIVATNVQQKMAKQMIEERPKDVPEEKELEEGKQEDE